MSRPARIATSAAYRDSSRVVAALVLGSLGHCGAALAAAPAADLVPLAPGLAYTVTSHVGLVSNRGAVPVADTEIVYSIVALDADEVSLRFDLSAGAGSAAGKLLAQAPTHFTRRIRREDLRSATRESLLFSSTDPELLPGQTYSATSAAVLAAMRVPGRIAFVLGVNEPDEGLAALSSAAAALPTSSGAYDGTIPLVMSGMQMMLGGPSRHYYRGTLERVGSADEPFSVLLDGRRTTVPAVHVRGRLQFTEREITPELWWLDDPGDPLTLKWAIAGNYEIVTRIDRAQPGGGTGSGRAGGPGPIASGLAGRSCRAELTGVYFTTASAQVLDASMPALQRFAGLMRQHPDWVVTVEGHTDNIGSAAYNLDLSMRRADAVRQALVGRFAVPAAQLRAKGYGLTRPVETNATDEGRAHNRRVEVSRQCGA